MTTGDRVYDVPSPALVALVDSVVGAPGVVIFRPGEPSPSGNVYADFAAAVAGAQATNAPVLLFDCSLQFPAAIPDGNYDLTTAAMMWGPANSLATLIECTNVTFPGFTSMTGIYLTFLGSAPAVLINDTLFHRFAMANDATIDSSSATAPFFSLVGSSLNVDMGFGATFQPTIGGPAISADATSSATLLLSDNVTVPNNSLTGAGSISADIFGGGVTLGATQTGATSYTPTDRRKTPAPCPFSAGALDSTAATAHTIPPGYAATTIAGSVGIGHETPSDLLASFTKASARLTGDAANVGGQTATFTFKKAGSSIATITGVATNGGVHTGSATISPAVDRAAGNLITCEVTFSGALTAVCTLINAAIG